MCMSSDKYLLWRAITDVPEHSSTRTSPRNLFPHTLAELKPAIHGHRSSTTPGATGRRLSYNIVKGWPDNVAKHVH